MDRGISQLENLWFLVTWNCGFKSILNTLGLNKAWHVKKLSHINEIFNTKGKSWVTNKTWKPEESGQWNFRKPYRSPWRIHHLTNLFYRWGYGGCRKRSSLTGNTRKLGNGAHTKFYASWFLLLAIYSASNLSGHSDLLFDISFPNAGWQASHWPCSRLPDTSNNFSL